MAFQTQTFRTTVTELHTFLTSSAMAAIINAYFAAHAFPTRISLRFTFRIKLVLMAIQAFFTAVITDLHTVLTLAAFFTEIRILVLTTFQTSFFIGMGGV